VQSPCIVDFGGRTLSIKGKVRVPNAGVLSFTAGSIEVRGPIRGRARDANGPDLSLTASNDIEVRKRIKANGRESAGMIALQAGGNIDILRGRIDARGASGTDGGTVTIEADGRLNLERPVRASSQRDGAGGYVMLRGDAGVTVDNSVDVRGLASGRVDVLSALDVLIDGKLSAGGTGERTPVGGLIFVESTTGNVTVDARLVAAGDLNGGLIEVMSIGGDVTLNQELSVRGDDEMGGTANVQAAGNIAVVDHDIEADGGTGGGNVVLQAGGAVTVDADIEADGRLGGGSIHVEGASVQAGISTGDVFDADGSGGMIRVEATGGNLTMAGRFDARDGGGRIEGIASGDLTASGSFHCKPDGCIGLSAGGNRDIDEGTFDKTVSETCPSPSGAFLEATSGVLD
jgi:hypothetical protein